MSDKKENVEYAMGEIYDCLRNFHCDISMIKTGKFKRNVPQLIGLSLKEFKQESLKLIEECKKILESM